MNDPDWLIWARELQAIAQTGLTFNPAGYDHERYVQLQDLAVRMLAARTAGEPAEIAALFSAQSGYTTPKIDVRAAIFRDGKILLVREIMDAGRWTLPGGWCDVGLTPAENAIKEVREETGFDVSVRKLAAVLDRHRQGHNPQIFHAYKLFFLCDITGGEATTSLETSEIAFFGEHEIPTDLSLERILPTQIARMFSQARQPDLPTDFE
jgi:ADP-ribose pyrophosphatase YjhB (NUDIX family)